MREHSVTTESRDESVCLTAHSSGKGAPAGHGRDDAGAPVKPDTVVLPMAVYAEHHGGRDGTAVVCPVCIEKTWYANTAYGYMRLTDYIEEHRDHTRPPLLEALAIGQGPAS